MRITVIGYGNVGVHLCRAFAAAGHEVVVAHGRDMHFAPGSDVYVLCVRDDVLRDVAERVCKVAGEALVVHTAGSVSLNVLGALRCGVLYPMQTFSRERDVDVKTVPFFVEGNNEESCSAVEKLALSVSNDVSRLSSEGRLRLHLAAVFASNFVNHCVAIADAQLRMLGLDWHIMLPLIDEVACKLHSIAPIAAQTGPAARGDVSVMRAHENMLVNTPEIDIYRRLSDNIACYAARHE